MEYVDSWLFNRGQEITLWRGPKIWRVAVQLFNAEGFPFKYLEGRDKEKLLLRALSLIRRDVAKDGQEVEYLDQAHEHGTSTTPFPIRVHSESESLEEWSRTPEFRKAVDSIVAGVRMHDLEKLSYGGEEDAI